MSYGKSCNPSDSGSSRFRESEFFAEGVACICQGLPHLSVEQDWAEVAKIGKTAIWAFEETIVGIFHYQEFFGLLYA